MEKVAKVLVCLSMLAAVTHARGGTVSVNGNVVNGNVWVDDALPAGAQTGADGGDSWNWVSANPASYSGSQSHQSNVKAGLHEHYFSGASQTLAVNTGDTLFAAVYIDPTNVPGEIMLQWNDTTGSWSHRAYWGKTMITYGENGTASSYYMGAIPAPGQWTLLTVPASVVGLEGLTLSGMAFTEYGGRATWDFSGDATSITTNSSPTGTTNPPVTTTNLPVTTGTNTTLGTGTTSTNGGSGTTTTTNSGTLSSTSFSTNAIPGTTPIDYTMLQQPKIGDNSMHVLSPTMLELNIVNSEPAGTIVPTNLELLNSSSQFVLPPAGAFAVTVNGQSVSVSAVGFKRRPLYAPNKAYDLRILNSIYLKLAGPVSDNQTVQVQNPGASLWPTTDQFVTTVDPLRYSPAIHVNEEGYMPTYPKQAMVGYYTGSLGEMAIPASSGFSIINATNGAVVFTGNLTARGDSGWEYSPAPYQQVYMADFSGFTNAGQYRLQVAGMGASLPFLIDGGIGMSFARTYALGLYHQRCGTNLGLPYTRFQHAICHHGPADVPYYNSGEYSFTWTTIAGYAATVNPNNPAQLAPEMTSPSQQLFPYVNTNGPIDVSGGHHDAGDYSKYTINSASLIHYLMFEVDSIPGVAAMDNLGIPESGDGISDVMQEAKWEADFLAKLQDADGGFYFLVYPTNGEYESNVTPDKGSGQVVWPKTTSVTAASVAALAQCASSPLFKKTYPAAAALYLQKALLGWKFLTNAVALYGYQKDSYNNMTASGAYQKLTAYGDNFADSDELAWAACQIYLATGDSAAHQKLLSWFDPANPGTWRWGWWHMAQSYGNCIRSYAFAVQSGRVASTSQLNATFLGKCQTEVVTAGNDTLKWSSNSAYGTSFPSATKAVNAAGWYFSSDQAFDMAVAYQLTNNPAYISGIVANLNYEAGCNPLNVCYVAGLGVKRPRDFVSQWELNDMRNLPPSGLPEGNIQSDFNYLWFYGTQLEQLPFPSDGAATAPYPFYDRSGDSWNVSTEMVILNSARSIGTLGFIAGQTAAASVPWKAVTAQINVPTTVAAVGSNVTCTMQALGIDFSGARITWEARDQGAAFGNSFTFAPVNNGAQWIEAEAQWPDGRRIFATNVFSANSANIVWVDDSIPTGGVGGGDGGDSWNWISKSPAAYSGSIAQQSAIKSGEHQVYFSGATATLTIGPNDTLYAWIYLDPANPPSEAMLQWCDATGNWHRANWGGNTLPFGPSTYVAPLPTVGKWQQLTVPASQVSLGGVTVNGLAFTLYGGRATWDCAGLLNGVTTHKITPSNPTPVPASIQMSDSTPSLGWATTVDAVYQVVYKNNLTDPIWTAAGPAISGTGAAVSWVDTNTTGTQRFYQVQQVQ